MGLVAAGCMLDPAKVSRRPFDDTRVGSSVGPIVSAAVRWRHTRPDARAQHAAGLARCPRRDQASSDPAHWQRPFGSPR